MGDKELINEMKTLLAKAEQVIESIQRKLPLSKEFDNTAQIAANFRGTLHEFLNETIKGYKPDCVVNINKLTENMVVIVSNDIPGEESKQKEFKSQLEGALLSVLNDINYDYATSERKL